MPLLVLTPFFTGALAAARGEGWNRSHDRALIRLLGQAGGAGALAGLALVLLGPIAVALLGRGEVPVPNSVLIAGAVFLVTTYLAAPLQAAFAGPKALWASVGVGVVVTVLAAGLSLWFTPQLGAAGPLWAASGRGAGDDGVLDGGVAAASITGWGSSPDNSWRSEVAPPFRLIASRPTATANANVPMSQTAIGEIGRCHHHSMSAFRSSDLSSFPVR